MAVPTSVGDNERNGGGLLPPNYIQKEPFPKSMSWSADGDTLLHRAVGHTQSPVGALIKRPPDRCEARIGISGGNHRQMIALGDVVLYQNHRAISDRPYGWGG